VVAEEARLRNDRVRPGPLEHARPPEVARLLMPNRTLARSGMGTRRWLDRVHTPRTDAGTGRLLGFQAPLCSNSPPGMRPIPAQGDARIAARQKGDPSGEKRARMRAYTAGRQQSSSSTISEPTTGIAAVRAAQYELGRHPPAVWSGCLAGSRGPESSTLAARWQ
jgi:hypothetical protein